MTDAGFYFGTQVVADRTGSTGFGLAIAFLYAGLMTGIVICLAERSTWHPERIFSNRLLTLGSWLVCYAWWYSWQELLYQLQGFGLWRLGLQTVVEQSLQVVTAIGGALCFTLMMSLVLVNVFKLGCCVLVASGTELEQQELKEASVRNASFAEFSACLGLPVQQRSFSIQLGSGLSVADAAEADAG